MAGLALLARKLDQGGAERQLITLARGLADRGHEIHVILFYRGGLLETELADSPVRVHYLDKSGRWDVLGFFLRLRALLRRLSPEVIYSFLDLPNILACLAKPRVGSPRMVWSIRAAGVEMRHYDWLARLVPLIESRMSRCADRVIANSQAGAQWAIQRGFPVRSMGVIENGIDTDRFQPDAAAGREFRNRWSIPVGKPVVAVVARLDVMKDHANFLRAAARLVGRGRDVHLLCVGTGLPAHLAGLQSMAAALSLDGRITWAGPQQDMPAVYGACDVLCLPSAFGEGFPNVVGEAMACGVPCVVTRVGDAARIVENWGEVVPPRDPEALARGLETMLDRMGREPELKVRVRERVESMFSIPRMLQRTEQALWGGP